MVKSNNPRDSIKLTSVDDLFSTEESRADSQREKVLDIPLSEISDFPNHPFKVKADGAAYFGHIRTLIPGTSGRCFGIIRTAFRLIRTPCRVN